MNVAHIGIPADLVESNERFFWEFVEENDRKAVESHLTAFYQNTEPHPSHCRELSFGIDAGPRPLSIRGETFATYDETGRLASLESLLTAVEDHEQENKFFRDILNLIPSWVFIKNARHEYQFVNESYAKVYGARPDECIGKTAIDLGADPECAIGNAEKGIEGFWAADRKVLETGEPVEIAAEPIVIDGDTRFLQTLKIPLASDHLFGFVHDVSTHKEMENRFAIELRDNKTINLVNVALRAGKAIPLTMKEVGQLAVKSLEAHRATIRFRDSEEVFCFPESGVVSDDSQSESSQSIVVPIEFADRQIGTLRVEREDSQDAFEAVDRNLAQSIANQVAFKIHQRELSAEISYRAYHDSLTDLPNRENLISLLSEATQLPRSQIGAVIFIDLDGFKSVNDTLGHHAGDDILCAVSQRLNSITEGENKLARLGGDEFGVLLPSLSSRECGMKIAEKYLESFRESFKRWAERFILARVLVSRFFLMTVETSRRCYETRMVRCTQRKAAAKTRVAFSPRRLPNKRISDFSSKPTCDDRSIAKS